ncbi:hypothetical protein OUZ56_023041 [Daphnia magna]|uniref:Peptidase S1 domain-containing protein n=1 Tax=Daphnia magna TaxID=35525 RepID=A0ABR0AY96_9CRUS|nr:hypothetical protein OUZ56_023041 [Daphnia magna]
MTRYPLQMLIAFSEGRWLLLDSSLTLCQSPTLIAITAMDSFTVRDGSSQQLRLTADIVFDYVNVDFVAYNEVDNTMTATAMGWGATFEGGLESVNLHYGEVDLLPMDSATTCGVYDNTKFNFATMLCAVASATATPAGSPCRYDEGSPLVQMFGTVPTAVGILSKTEGCLAAAHGVYIRVSVYYSWIANSAGQQPIRTTTVATPVMVRV